MALDAEFFDSIYIEVVKKKYYEAAKVQQVFEEIRRRAEELNAENEDLRRELAEQKDRRVELGDALLSAQTVYQDIIDRARERADAITADAQRRSEALLAESRRRSEQILARSREQEENTAHRVEEAFDRMKKLHMDSIDALNAQWQDFLCSLDPEAQLPDPDGGKNEMPEPERELPADLEEKVGAIAEELFSLERE